MTILATTAMLLEQELIYPAESKASLRIKKPSCPIGSSAIDSVLPHNGLPFGAIHEIFTTYNTPPLALFAQIATNSHLQKPILWIGESMNPTPQFLAGQNKLLLGQSIFVKPRSKKNLLWAIDEASQCRGIWGIFSDLPSVQLSFLRKLSIAVKDSGIFIFLFRSQKDKSLTSNALSRWELSPSACNTFDISLLRYKGLFHEPITWPCDFLSLPQ